MIEHQLSFEQLRVRPHVTPVDENGTVLRVTERVVEDRVDTVLSDASGSEKIAVRKDALGFLDTEDPQRRWDCGLF